MTKGMSNLLYQLLVTTSVVSLALLFSLGCDGDDGVSSEFASVSGTITFKNIAMWPDSGEVQVTIFPAGATGWTAMGPLGPPQNPNDPVVLTKNGTQNQYDFTIDGLPEGGYSALAVGWRRPNAQNYPGNKRTASIGVFWSDPDSASSGLNIPMTPLQEPLPTAINLSKGEEKSGLNLTADFGYVPIFIQLWQII